VTKLIRPTGVKIASILFYLHGAIEIAGAAMLLLVPPDLLAATGLPFEKSIPLVSLSLISGVFRLFIGYAVWLMRKWGAVLGVIFSAITIIGAPQFLPFGIMDTIIAMVILVLLAITWFGEEAFTQKRE
jgi:uncharacterized membrane protein YphA (DoxX/SURF4 family)